MEIKRVLWLYNHSTLIKSEVPILRQLGYEVYIPKIPPFDVSISVDWESDELLSVPKEDLDILNNVNYYTERIPTEAMEIMNKYFQMAIFGVFIEPLKSIVSEFTGIQVFHPFGLEDGLSYTKIIEAEAGSWLLSKIEEVGNRFWFAQSYDNLSEIECDTFQRRTIYLPIGMKDVTIHDKWRGDKGKLLFICPRIKMNKYYEKLYEWFKKEFSDIPHSIGGAQPIAIENDKNVLGYLDQKDYEDLYPSHSVMFYHSQEKRHIHYHPFEAVKCGLPLIFMADGLLDRLGGANLPGRCKDIREARKKCLRIINGDRKYAEHIRKSQKVLLEKMSFEFCLQEWKKGIGTIVQSNNSEIKKKKKIAVILPQSYEGGVLDYTIRILKALAYGINKEKSDIELVLGYLENDNNDYKNKLQQVEKWGISLREFFWEKVDNKRIKEISGILGLQLSFVKQSYYLLNDGMRYFQDCNFILYMTDRVPGVPFLLQPYGVIAHDYIQRYVPELFRETYEKDIINITRASECIFTTSEAIKKDCIQYVGVRSHKIARIPRFFDNIKEEEIGIFTQADKAGEYFVWSTNLSVHKNHIIALKALKKYYQNGGKLNCCITGSGTEVLKDEMHLNKYMMQYKNEKIAEYVAEIYEFISNDSLLKKHILILGTLPKKEYYGLLKSARFFFHPGFADNGNGGAFDAAMLGVGTISSDYPAMREMNNEMNLGMKFFDRNNAEQIAEMLIYGEKDCINIELPSKEELFHHTVENEELCEKIYNQIRQKMIL